MYNNISFNSTPSYQMDSFRSQLQRTQPHQLENHFVYAKEPISHSRQLIPPVAPVKRSQTVLINPRFQGQFTVNNSKVFLNPNFSGSTTIHVNPRLKVPVPRTEPQATKIHVNPNVKNIKLPVTSQTVHINPKFTNVIANLNSQPVQEVKVKPSKAVVLTRTKLIRSHSPQKKLKRRNSVKSMYKIVKTGSPSSSRASPHQDACKNKYKIDNRNTKLGLLSPGVVKKYHKKHVYVNKNSSALVKNNLVKGNVHKIVKGVNINGVTYRKSRNSIQRTSVGSANMLTLVKDKNKKIVTNQTRPRRSIVKKFKIIRRHSPKKAKEKVSPGKLKKCNIPCPIFRKYGNCKGKDNRKCNLKHDPDQVALCTRFLQGACLKEKCLLSHNVSPEKMPTCKYFLEGTCSKENCPYLHVKISPKAEVCRDFLEGFCKKAAECDKRHQYLCPDYEKYGKCVKQRCAYPHGNMVRTYLMNKNKFVKKSSEFKPQKAKQIVEPKNSDVKGEEKRRYYAGNEGGEEIVMKNDEVFKTYVGLHSRPKLGVLPSFIPLDDNS